MQPYPQPVTRRIAPPQAAVGMATEPAEVAVRAVPEVGKAETVPMVS